MEYGHLPEGFRPQEFPAPPAPIRSVALTSAVRRSIAGSAVDRARRYLARVEPAVAGQRGEQHTFRSVAGVVRGFALSDDDALSALQGWNSRCAPPWSERDSPRKSTGREDTAVSRSAHFVTRSEGRDASSRCARGGERKSSTAR